MLRYKVLTDGCDPLRAREEDAGIDLRAGEDTYIDPMCSAIIPLGIAVKVPDGMYAMLTHRSSLAFGKECTASLGIIDSNFTQEIKAKVFNHSRNNIVHIEKGDRICQLVIHKYQCLEMSEEEDLGLGKGGFGSSGSN